MSDAAQLPDTPGDVSASVAEMQIAKIFASRHFRKADRLKRFLQFVTEETLKGRGERIKESLIGLAVFDRQAATYDPGVDPIVRVQAGRVRAKLSAYYEEEGADDDVLIEVPRGQYAPTFRIRPRHSPSHVNGKTRSIDAVNHHLKGRFYWNKRNQRGLRTAIHHFQEATRIDPDYGRAHSGLADCYIMLSMSGAEAPLECMPFARRSALRAIEIDDGLVEAHTSLAAVLANFDWDRSGAEREFRRALEIDPGYATLHH